MAKNKFQLSLAVKNMQTVGKPRTSKKKKGNAPARTARSGSGRKIR